MPAAQAPNTLPPRPAKDEGAIQIVQIPEARVKYENTIRLRRYGYLAFILFVVYVVVQHRKAQKLEREKIHPYWGRPSLESQSCIAYNTRRYNARLWNVPLNFDWHTICMSIPIKIHNLELTVPERCEIRGDYVYGTWRVDDNEPSCQARWGDLIEDKGCIRPGVHVIEAPLVGQKPGDDVYSLCMTTPGNLGGDWGMQGHPTDCERRGDEDLGMVGRWEIKDNNCN